MIDHVAWSAGLRAAIAVRSSRLVRPERSGKNGLDISHLEKTVARLIVSVMTVFAAFAVSGCCAIPSYTPSFWNDGGVIHYNNNCYNYANNKRTDTFAQPGRAAGAKYTSIQCANVRAAAVADGVIVCPAGGCPKGTTSEEDTLALVVGPGWDYHWYRQDVTGMWSHKPGGTSATNLDNSDNPITSPATADRGWYTDFCGYHCSCSSATEGAGYEIID